MTDRELLELAAKSVGEWPSPEPFEHVLQRWNPITDDGDALRLAVKLGLAIDRTSNRCWAWRNGWTFQGVCEEFYGDDPYAATRRAIVRASAEIGKLM